ncbi:MAG TPA: diguanylate cyclase [Caulifigura sp.]|jgi:diguanylate cyclase (GGDEF)-like protein|nr:diguanylate cyclase [Caulifigura sp.]
MNPKVLVIDDSPELHTLVRVRLAREAVTVSSALDAATGISEARKGKVDLILLDVDMPDRDGFSVCAELKSHPELKDIPIIFLSGATSTSDKIRGLDLGAVDYIAKPFDAAELRARVRASLRTRELMVLLAKKAMIDGLTGLWNRRYLDAQMMVELAASRRTGEPLGCIMADVDHFKLINDKYGHGFGDDVLRKIAAVLTENCRPKDIVCRYGGEEFAILLPDTTPAKAVEVAERLRQTVEQLTFQYFDRPVPVTCSFGVAYLRDRVPPTVLELADEALYSAKHCGRNCVVRWEEPRHARECCAV